MFSVLLLVLDQMLIHGSLLVKMVQVVLDKIV